MDALVLFGSVARGEATRSSDIDIVVIGPNPAATRETISWIGTDLTYEHHAMFHAVQAALIAAKARSHKTQSGAMNPFSRHYISTGRMAREFVEDLQDAYDLRQQSDDDVYTAVGEAQVREMIQKADAFVTAVKTLLGRVS